MKQIKKVFALTALTALLLCTLFACGKSDGVENPAGTCTLSISCATVLDNMDDLAQGKEELIPDDGWMLAPEEIEFSEGETVSQLLQRVLQSRKIQFEFEGTDDGAYIKAVGNLYEMDCGDMSGWQFSVNGEYPGVAMGSYEIADGDRIELNYTCNFGEDLTGAANSVESGEVASVE